LFNPAKKILDLVVDVLQERRATLDHISKLEKMTGKKNHLQLDFSSFRKQLQEILPQDFLKHFSNKQLIGTIRYCKALTIRIDRAYISPEKDRAKASQLVIHQNKLHAQQLQDPSPQCLELLKEYRLMLEEYKISLFAPEIKTLFPISAKRLEKKWQAISDSC
jgi:ATP-dependent helicase HrpA